MYGRNHWIAFACSFVLMGFWVWTPLGSFITDAVGSVRPDYAIWTWPVGAVTFYWIVRAALTLSDRRKRK